MAINLSLPKDKAGQQKLFIAVVPFLIFFVHARQEESCRR